MLGKALWLGTLLLGMALPSPTIQVVVEHGGIEAVPLPPTEVTPALDLAWHSGAEALYGLSVRAGQPVLRRWDRQGALQREWPFPADGWPYTLLYLRDNLLCVVVRHRREERPFQEWEFRESGGQALGQPRGAPRWWHELLPELDRPAPAVVRRLRRLSHLTPIIAHGHHQFPATAVENYPFLVGGYCPQRGFSAELERRGGWIDEFCTDWDPATGRLVGSVLLLRACRLGPQDQVEEWELEDKSLTGLVDGYRRQTRRVRIVGEQILAEIWTTPTKESDHWEGSVVRLDMRPGRLQARQARPGRLARLLRPYRTGR
ncbi:MAG: hypothetical protein FJX77_08335 [Armatimonadetes bacterium]|nr:hypothetical protein [Armatimonadota bacterium]